MSEYFKILEDCLLIESIEPITKTTSRKRLTKSPKFLLFDMGIRRVLAREGEKLPVSVLGKLFEQFIGLELIRSLRTHFPAAKLRYWRDHAGPEVDYVIDYQQHYLPIEVKWTNLPTAKDAKHLLQFMADYQCIRPGYIICRCDKPLLIHENIIALPWQALPTIIEALQKNIPQS